MPNNDVTLYAIYSIQKFNCKNYSNGGKRLRVLNITTCSDSQCDFDMLNGLNLNYNFYYDVNYQFNWNIQENQITSTISDCSIYHYYTSNNKCYFGASENSGTKITIPYCTSLSLYRTTMKNSNGDNWYYLSGKDCYVDGEFIRSNPTGNCSSSSGWECPCHLEGWENIPDNSYVKAPWCGVEYYYKGGRLCQRDDYGVEHCCVA